MSKLNPYLNFPGNCREALHFYESCFPGAKVSFQTYSQAPDGFPDYQDKPESKDYILHGEIVHADLHLMACDNPPNMPLNTGNNVNLMLNVTSAEEQDRIFNALAQGGNITMPLEDTFWNARFGMLTDKFGIIWMLNLPKN